MQYQTKSRQVSIVYILALLLLCFCFQSSAIEVTDLYQAKVEIADQTRPSRNAAQREAFSKVLVKVSGNYEVLENSAVKTATRQAASFVRKFQFLRGEDGEQLIEVKFDEGKINRLLRRESLPIWGKRRPAILLWMAGEDAQTLVRHVISKESYGHLLKQMAEVSQARGLPVLFPLYDIEDNEKVSVSDVWGYFYQHIRKFSDRYNSDAMVISRFYHRADENTDPDANVETRKAEQELEGHGSVEATKWTLEWRLFEQDKRVDIQAIEGDLSEVLTQLVHHLADRYAEEYAVNSSNLVDAERMILTVRNVGKIEHLVNAEKLLLSFSAVADVMLRRLNRDVAEFEITLVGEPLDLIQGLELEQQFEKIFDPFYDPTLAANEGAEPPTEFKWVP